MRSTCLLLASVLACTSPVDDTGAAVVDDTAASDTADTDTDTDTDADTDSDTDTDTAPGADYGARDLRQAGTYAVGKAQGSVTASCEMAFTSYTPTGLADPPLVVLSHGFARDRANMDELATHFASWGMQVVTPALCNASFLNADHPANAADLRALVDALGDGAVVYAGHSAGGLASFIAAGADSRAVGVLGLDPVDTDGLGAAAAGSVSAPAYALLGVSSSCNSSANGVFFGGAGDARLLDVIQADHCDFEGPTDFLCGLACADAGTTFTDDEVRGTILGLATSYLLWRTGREPEAQADAWWTAGGAWHDDLVSQGRVVAR